MIELTIIAPRSLRLTKVFPQTICKANAKLLWAYIERGSVRGRTHMARLFEIGELSHDEFRAALPGEFVLV